MLHVPGGTFTMGVPGGASSPAHEVTLDPYYIDQVEVTNAMYAACVEDGGCEPPGSTVNYYGGPYYGSAVLNNYPVASVSWFAAEAYCAWRGARLPSEAEWEMAARWDSESGEVTRFPWGDDPDPLRANYCDVNCPLNSADPGGDDGWELAAPVGSFLSGSSPVGALDMAGNVAEWVADWFGAETYQSGTLTNPRGPFVGTNKVVRGGAWGVPFDRLASTERSGFPPGSESVGLGFRCAASAEEVDG
jgi:formylglycine-generating enzyme required for sulfatase activity